MCTPCFRCVIPVFLMSCPCIFNVLFLCYPCVFSVLWCYPYVLNVFSLCVLIVLSLCSQCYPCVLPLFSLHVCWVQPVISLYVPRVPTHTNCLHIQIHTESQFFRLLWVFLTKPVIRVQFNKTIRFLEFPGLQANFHDIKKFFLEKKAKVAQNYATRILVWPILCNTYTFVNSEFSIPGLLMFSLTKLQDFRNFLRGSGLHKPHY